MQWCVTIDIFDVDLGPSLQKLDYHLYTQQKTDQCTSTITSLAINWFTNSMFLLLAEIKNKNTWSFVQFSMPWFDLQNKSERWDFSKHLHCSCKSVFYGLNIPKKCELKFALITSLKKWYKWKNLQEDSWGRLQCAKLWVSYGSGC